MSRFNEVLERLCATIESRRGADPTASWSARLIGDPALAGKKLAEEAVETAIAAVQGDREAIAKEGADVVFHLLALLVGAGVSLDEVASVLEAREGRSGLEEKAARQE